MYSIYTVYLNSVNLWNDRNRISYVNLKYEQELIKLTK